jgi:adenosylcobinamide-phosphate guanylyltransferase
MHHRNTGDDPMGVVALVMAGGRATRMGNVCEKPLLRICGKTMVERVIEALRGSKNIDEIIGVVSKFTPKTAESMRNFSIKVVETPGEGYCSDMRHAIKKYALFSPVLTISADLPLITKELIDEIVTHYKQCKKPALAVAVPLRTYKRLGLKVGHPFEARGKRLVYVGINVVDGKHVDKPRMAQEIMVLEKAEPVVNVNTLGDLEIAEKLLVREMNQQSAAAGRPRTS